MTLPYQCPDCGTELGYKGLCWRCRTASNRRAALAWRPEEVAAKEQEIIAQIEDVPDDFWYLLCCRGRLAPEIPRAALAARSFWPSALYYHAPADVRDGLIAALMETDVAHEANELMMCLGMQGDDHSLAALLALERNPRPWRGKLHVDPSVYAQCGGWTFDREGRRRTLNFDTCYPLVHAASEEELRRSPIRIARPREEHCPHCGSRMADMLVLNGRDARLHFLGIDGILTATCCPNCVAYAEPILNRYTLDGGSEVLSYEDTGDTTYIEEELVRIFENDLILGETPVPLFYGARFEDTCTLGGFALWWQDWEYTTCPDCGQPMKYLMQIHWEALTDYMEGTLYIEFCPDCRIVSMQHQQT